MLWDTHLHTKFSGDSTANPRDMVESSIKRGLSGICFTDHQDLGYARKPGLFDLDFENYKQEIYLLKEEYQNRFPILLGVELGLQPDTAEGNKSIADCYPFDFVIGSSHEVNHMDIYYPDFYEGRKEDDCYLEYFESILSNLHTDADFDVYGHLDYIVRYGPNKNKYYSYRKFADIIDEILRLIIEKGKGIELNTAGFKYGLGHPHPTEDILKRYRQLGGEIITLGSDGHAPEQVAWDFHKVPDLLKEAGFLYFTIFKERKAEFIKLR
uniref:histidinol-phosphatase HisJ family protein n=1 Tax=Agathobacter sp. TaxID=2021311 RepID=UPI00405656E6